MKIVEVRKPASQEPRKEQVEETLTPRPLTEQVASMEATDYYGLHMGRAGDSATAEDVRSLKKSDPRLYKKIVNMD